MKANILLILVPTLTIFLLIHYSFACSTFIQNPNKTQVLQYFNQAKIDNVSGICSLAALQYYNNTGILKLYNLNMDNLTIYINRDIENFSSSIKNLSVNTTTFSLKRSGEYCIMFTPKGKANSKFHKAHVHLCNPGWDKISQLKINVTTPNTTLVIPESIIKSSNNSENTIGIYAMQSNESTNWVGYAITLNGSNQQQSVSSISGSWVVEPALKSQTSRVAGQWIGIGGYQTSLLTGPIQIGTSSCYNVNFYPSCLSQNNLTHYGAWFEVIALPTDIISLPISIKPGNHIYAHIYSENGYWIGYILNLNTSTTSIVIYPYDSLDTSLVNSTAEWIDERPSESIFGLYNFDNFVTTNFSNSSAVIDSKHGQISSFTNYYIHNISMYSNTQPINDTAITTNFTGSAFEVKNFRINSLEVHSKTIKEGKLYIIFTQPNNGGGTAIDGGTGPYKYTWLLNYSAQKTPSNPKFSNATDCNAGAYSGFGNNPQCYVAPSATTIPGNYTYMLEAQNWNVTGEVAYSNKVTVEVIPSSFVNSYPIYILNDQQATAAPFQQMLVIDSAAYSGIDSNWSNVEFTTGQNATGTVLDAWVESNASSTSTHTVVWIKIPEGLPTGTSKIYMNIMPEEVMSASGPTGEAPELSPSYGEYDDGALVFDYYTNFSRSTSGWYPYNPNVSAVANDGLSLTINGNGYFVTNSEYGLGTVFDAYIESPQDTQNIGYIDASEQTNKSVYGNIGWTGAYIRAACGVTYPDQANATKEINTCGDSYGTLANEEGVPGIYSVIPLSSTESEQSLNYGTYKKVSGGFLNYPMHVGFSIMGLDKGVDTIKAYWALVRAEPPNGVMPSYSFSYVNSANIDAISTTTTTSIASTSTAKSDSTSTSSTSSTTTTI